MMRIDYVYKICTKQEWDILKQKKRLPEPLLFFPLSHKESIEIDNFEDLEFPLIFYYPF